MTRFILSDDLTGAAGVASMVGPSLAVTVNLDSYDPALAAEFPCVVINLEAREKSEREALRLASEALSLVGDAWVALRIDSALRGAVKGLVREVASRGRILVTDTIPEYGRITLGGKTIIGESVKDLREKLRPLQAEMREGSITVADSATWRDLRGLATRCARDGLIPVDPGPLVSIVVRASFDESGKDQHGRKRARAERVAFVIGTSDGMTLKQLRYMGEHGHKAERPSPLQPAAVRIFSFSLDRDSAAIDTRFIESLRGYDAIVLSGGATASAVLGKSGFSCIVSGDQIQPLLSTGLVRGGALDGKRVVLKGGFIGDEKTYKTILDWLTQT